MKKLKFLIFLPLLFLLTACGPKPKETFISYLKANSNQEQVAYDYTVKIDDVVMGEEATESISDKDLKKAKLSFHIQQDLKNNLLNLSTDLSKLSPELPKLDLIYADDKMYASAEMISSFAGLDADKVKGKYIDLAEFSGQDIPSLSEAQASAKDADFSWIEEVDDANFTEKDGKVTATFTVPQLFKAVSATAKTEMTEEMETYLKQAEASISDKSTVTYTLDDKGNGTAKLDLTLAKGADKNLKSVKATLDFKKATFKAAKAPAKADVLKQEDLAKLMAGDSEATDAVAAQPTDEEFALFYEELEKEVGTMTQDEYEALLEILKGTVTDAQYKKLEALKSKATA